MMSRVHIAPPSVATVQLSNIGGDRGHRWTLWGVGWETVA